MSPEQHHDLTPDEVLGRFSEATRAWFTGAFAAPTPAQLGAWDAVSRGQHALVVAPTGSGKTLSAFLWALDGLAAEAVPEDKDHRCRVLYISPLKALAVDVERNLRSPLTGIRQAAQRLGLPVPDVRVGVRSGDTPAEERRGFTRTPPDVLITTPESLFLLLTSKAREQLRGVRTVVLDEVHAMAGSKRGAHLAISLERLDALVTAAGGEPTQRVGLSATVRPVQAVAEWVSGGRPVTIVQPPSTKEFDLKVVVPVEDMSQLDASGRGAEDPDDLSGQAAGNPRRASIWPHVEERIVDLVAGHRSTLVFANSSLGYRPDSMSRTASRTARDNVANGAARWARARRSGTVHSSIATIATICWARTSSGFEGTCSSSIRPSRIRSTTTAVCSRSPRYLGNRTPRETAPTW
jgi:ATP-dependent Lhr-like helicase